MERGEKAVRRSHTQTPAQRASQYLAMPLEEHVAFLKQEELTLDEMLKRLPIPNRPYAQVPPRLPPYFGTVDRERRARMIEECAQPGKLQSTIQQIWLPLFTPPPPPSYIPKEDFMAQMGKAIEQRFHDVVAAVQKLRARGGKVVFVRLPHQRRVEDSRRSRHAPRADLGSITARTQLRPEFTMKIIPSSRFQLSRMVAPLCRRFRRVQQAFSPPSSRGAPDVIQ